VLFAHLITSTRCNAATLRFVEIPEAPADAIAELVIPELQSPKDRQAGHLEILEKLKS